MERKKCESGGCLRDSKARGLCATHYAQWRKGIREFGPIKTRVMEKPPECSEDGCTEAVKAKGLCHMHYQRFLRHGHMKHTIRTKDQKKCSVKGCDEWLYANGMCNKHNMRERIYKQRGITAQKYEEMLAAQNGFCAICGGKETKRDPRTGKLHQMAVDHNHQTGATRGLLCSTCNRAIGLLNDSIETLQKAIEYLKSYQPQ